MRRKEKSSNLDAFLNEKYKLIVLDMDGTLYYQRSMQILMCMEMGAFAIMHPFSLWKLKAVSVFRKVREREEYAKENWSTPLLASQYALTAEQIERTCEEVKQTIEEWMFIRPLKYLQYTQDKELCTRVSRWQCQGKKVVVYSDYPVEEKCEALGLHPDAMYSSDAEQIGKMKPSAKGLEVICDEWQVTADDILVVGDRMSKDGKMAEAFGSEYVILDKWKILRVMQYKKFHNF